MHQLISVSCRLPSNSPRPSHAPVCAAQFPLKFNAAAMLKYYVALEEELTLHVMRVGLCVGLVPSSCSLIALKLVNINNCPVGHSIEIFGRLKCDI